MFVCVGVLVCFVFFVFFGCVESIGGFYVVVICLVVILVIVVIGFNVLSSFEVSEDECGGKLGMLRSWG